MNNKKNIYFEGKPDKFKSLIEFSANKSKIKPIISLIMLLLTLISCPLGLILLFTGSITTKIFLIICLIYQFFFCKKQHWFVLFIRKINPTLYFKSYGSIIDKRDNIEVASVLSDSKSLFCFSPHGVIGISFMMEAVMNEYIYCSSVCSSRGIIYTPFTGIFAQWFGFESVDNIRFENDMKKGKNISLVPGGFEEATLTDYNSEKIFIKERKGFIKYALKYGYKVHPIYCFNENRLFYTITSFEALRLFLNKFKIPAVIAIGAKYLLFPNYDVNRVTVFSSGIQLPMIKNPTNSEVNHYHQLYIDELKYIYNKYKAEFGGVETLEIY
jgi:hypothetical protein